MFKKSNKLSPQPVPPSVEQIMEDLETFCVEHKPLEKIRSFDTSNAEEPDIEDWWKVFETYLEDHDQFHNMKIDIENLKKKLLATQNELQEARDNIQRQIDEDLEKIRLTIKS
ncbi:uncharacterized protein LOC110681064 [Aedes aegypti]|uniref:Uncharacterized protein n=1 Tax=Aedes aegypti TaxID=7159 RepID=A0A6I8U2P0_AEDAE|nr:uncharacterized protein LOC110675168 [Aedes aegypti]XP_021712524.1 uncharacterized protein LOC110681064 [Aedes aegypti]